MDISKPNFFRGRRGGDRMVIVFTTTYAISVYHSKVVSRCTRCNALYDKVCQVGSFLRVIRFPPPIKLTATI